MVNNMTDKDLKENKVNILIVDAHNFHRYGLEAYIGNEYSNFVFHHAKDETTALSICKNETIDIVITDVFFNDHVNNEYIERLCKNEKLKVIILSSHSAVLNSKTNTNVYAMFSKKECHKFILTVINSIINGYSILAKPQTSSHTLSRRESDVFNLLMRGYRNSEIAKALNLRSKTIEMHKSKILKKFNVKSILDMPRRAIVYV